MFAPANDFNTFLKNRFTTHGKRTALNADGKAINYEDLLAGSSRLANAFIRAGIRRNARIGMLIPNSIEYVVTELAIYFSGGTKVALNTMLRETDIEYILNDSSAEIMVVDHQYLPIIENVKDKLTTVRQIVVLNGPENQPEEYVDWHAFKDSESADFPEVGNVPDDMTTIQYTGGTTGEPKGVIYTRERTLLTLSSIIIDADVHHDEKILVTTPLPHAAWLYTYTGLIMGAEIFIEEKFDLETVVRHIEENRITFLSLVPTIIYRLLDYLEGKDIDVSSIRTIQYGTAPITAERLKQGLERFGPVFTQIYGLSETQSAATWLRKDDHLKGGKLLRSCGKPAYFSAVKIVDDEGNEVPAGEPGEILVKAVTNMTGYLNKPEKTKEALTEDGWLHTGDVGSKDEDGYIYLLDRKKDMIISGGMNVYSSEVENALQLHPAIRQVAVIGVPDEDWGEAVHAFVILKDTITDEELVRFSKDNMSKYKVPKAFHIVDEFPLTNYGKVDKKALREPFWKVKERQI